MATKKLESFRVRSNIVSRFRAAVDGVESISNLGLGDCVDAAMLAFLELSPTDKTKMVEKALNYGVSNRLQQIFEKDKATTPDRLGQPADLADTPTAAEQLGQDVAGALKTAALRAKRAEVRRRRGSR